MFGVHSAMSLQEAGRRCPDGVFLPVDGRRYQQASREVMAILRRFTPLVEPISIDEAFLDVTGSRALFGDGETIAARDQGGGPRRGRPDRLGRGGDDEARGQDRVRPAQARRAGRRAAGRGGGVPRAAADLAAVGRRREDGRGPGRVRRADDRRPGRAAAGRRRAPVRQARRRRSSTGRGASTPTRSHDGDPAKSIGHEHTFDVDTSDPEVIERTLLAMADGVAGRLRSAGVRASTITVKLRDSSFRTITRQRTLPEPTDLTEPIYRVALDLARPEIARACGSGCWASRRRTSASASSSRLFAADDPRRRAATEAADALRRRYGVARGDPRPAGRERAAGAVRARPAQPARPARTGHAGRGRRRRSRQARTAVTA